ncbi:MAG TPA: cupredoxin domain-containing protein [Anaerolineae bacterium]|jgi:heme/copper-type cytochrome/quinol oxidase subunit 2|nr:cupredoxin domain-containing protein [Anaerolineae bacterium]
MSAQATVTAAARPMLQNWPRLVLALLALAITFTPLPAGTGVVGPHHVQIAASQYDFKPGVISVNKGDKVTIELASADVVHGLYLDGYDLEVTADPGQSASLTFIADKSGTFRFRCSVTCGPLHPFMIGKLKVGNNTLLWRGMALAVLAASVGLWRFRR